ncbi:MAG: SEC-C metal-binding domain-containing protein, partial [Anaerolineales bacterium]
MRAVDGDEIRGHGVRDVEDLDVAHGCGGHQAALGRKLFRVRNARVQPGRNDPCPCGSGKKYKKCCGASGAGSSAVRRQPVSLDAAIVAFESGRYAAAAEAAQSFTRVHPN